jgi:hypothetical protein
MSDQITMPQLAWMLLHKTNDTQAKGSTRRWVNPREAAPLLGLTLNSEPVIAANDYLEDHGYIEDTYALGGRPGRGLYYITPNGMDWLENPPSDVIGEP